MFTETQIESENARRFALYQQLFLYGDFMPLDISIDLELFRQQLIEFKDNWKVYNEHKGFSGRYGLSLTSLDGGMTGNPDLQSLYEYSKQTGKNYSENDFCIPTAAVERMTSLHSLFHSFEGGLGRCRLVSFEKGGYFPPHRDQSISFQVPDYFRIFVPLQNTGDNSLFFIYEDKKIKYEKGRAYLFNALKTHSVFSFSNDAITLAMSLKLNFKNVKSAISHLLVK